MGEGGVLPVETRAQTSDNPFESRATTRRTGCARAREDCTFHGGRERREFFCPECKPNARRNERLETTHLHLPGTE